VWCSAFANWCVERAVHAGAGHVGFFVKSTATEIRLLGGNQSDKVCESSYSCERLMGYRLPS
jgi:hypothetical protein